MKLSIEKRDLLNLLGKTLNIVEKKNTMPILSNVLLEADSGVLRVFATDLEVSLRDEVSVEVLEAGKVAISAKNLYEISKELGEGKISLIKKENNWLEIKQNRYTSKIVGISHEEYPVFPTVTGTDFLTLDSSVLKDMIDKTIYSVSTDETRYHLNGVFFQKFMESTNSNIRMVATDGHRLSLVERKADEKFAKANFEGVIVPRKGLNEIKKLLDSSDGIFEMAVEGSQLVVRHKATLLMIRLIEAKYPNYQQLIPQRLAHLAHINREAFLTSLKRVALLANQKSKGVTLSLSNGKMEISSNNPDLGDAKEEIEINYQGKELKIGFNAKYIQEVLANIQDTEIDFELNDQLSPGLVRPHNDPSYTCVVMPMRI